MRRRTHMTGNGIRLFALVLCHVVATRSVLSQEASALQDIRQAWAERQAYFQAVTATWVVDDSDYKARRTEVPDPNPSPQHRKLLLLNDQLREESSWRNYDIDGGPNGSKVWQTITRFESYSDSDGWRRVSGTELSNVLPSVTINRPPDLGYTGIKGRGLFVFWFRGLVDEFTLARFDDWQITDDPRFASDDPSEIVLMQGSRERGVLTLTVNRDLHFLPIRSTKGRWPNDGDPYVTYREWSVQFISHDDPELPIWPTTWTEQEFRQGQLIKKPVISELEDLRFECSLSSDEFRVVFPPGRKPLDQSLSTALSVAQFAITQRNAPQDNVSTKHATHWGYWTALGFAGVLLFAVAKRLRGTLIP